MKFCREKIAYRKTQRLSKFRVLDEIPKKKIFRRSKEPFFLLILFLILIFYFSKRINHVEDAIGMSVSVFVSAIFAFGFAVKLILSLIFPIIVLNETGIKLIGDKIIRWDQIRTIKVKHNLNFEQVIYITKVNSKVIKKNIKPDNFSRLDLYCRSYLRKHKGLRIKSCNDFRRI